MQNRVCCGSRGKKLRKQEALAESLAERHETILFSSVVWAWSSIQARHHILLLHGREIVDVETLGSKSSFQVLRYQPVVELWGNGEFCFSLESAERSSIMGGIPYHVW